MKIFLLLIFTLIVFACTPPQKKVGMVENYSLIVADLDMGKKISVINASSIFNKVNTIILETGKDCLVGSDFIFSAFDNYLFILNVLPTKDFLLFDREGKFIRKIGGLGRGPGEYTRIFDFTVDPDNKVIYLLCDLVINKYSFDGAYIGAIRLKKHTSFIQYVKGKLYIESRDGKYLLQSIDPETGRQTDKFLENALYNKGWDEPNFKLGRPFLYRSVESPKFKSIFMDTIFSIHHDKPVPFLALKSKNLTNNADVKVTVGLDPFDRIQAIIKKNKIFHILDYFETKSHLFFTYMNGDKIFPILYYFSTSSFINSFLCNDIVFNLNITDKKQSPFSFIYSDSNGVYECFWDNVKHEIFLEWIKEGKLAINLDKRDQLMKITEDSNPVIFYYSYDDEE